MTLSFLEYLGASPDASCWKKDFAAIRLMAPPSYDTGARQTDGAHADVIPRLMRLAHGLVTAHFFRIELPFGRHHTFIR